MFVFHASTLRFSDFLKQKVSIAICKHVFYCHQNTFKAFFIFFFQKKFETSSVKYKQHMANVYYKNFYLKGRDNCFLDFRIREIYFEIKYFFKQ